MKKTLLTVITSLSIVTVYGQNTFPSSGNVGIGTTAPLSRLNIVHQAESSDKGALIIGNGSAPSLRFGYNTTYSWIQAHGSAPLYINELGNNLILNRSGGNVGIGTVSPTNRLDVRGNVTIDNGITGAGIYTGTGTVELNRYLSIFNSTGKTSASGLKAGGVLIADVYDYSNPGKNDLVVKGDVGIGTPKPTNKLDVRGHITMEAGRNPTIFTGIGTQELNRYLTLINSTGLSSASGLKAGGLLVADAYAYADPGKNDLVVKGSVSIGAASSRGHKLAVNGTIRAKEIKVESTNWPDYVFEDNYDLKPLPEIEAFIKTNRHLPGVPDQKQAEEEGVNLGEMNRKLLEKVEELTLHLIDEQKARLAMEKEIAGLKVLVESRK